MQKVDNGKVEKVTSRFVTRTYGSRGYFHLKLDLCVAYDYGHSEKISVNSGNRLRTFFRDSTSLSYDSIPVLNIRSAGENLLTILKMS